MNRNRTYLPWTLAVRALVLFLLTVSPAFAQEEVRQLGRAEQMAFQQAANAVAGAVVQLQHFGDRSRAPVTGVLIAPGGWVVTSFNSLEERPTRTLVTLANGQRCPARLVARDFSRHLALFQSQQELSGRVPALKTAAAPQPGQWAIAIGRTHRVDKVSLSVGVVSATHRFGGRAVQTDAAVSPANYGGPLVNLAGEVIGILVPLAPPGQQGTEWYDSGIGFAVPLDQILARLETLQAGHDIKPGQLGLSLAPGDPLRNPPVVAAVFPTGPAEEAGIAPGDAIIAFDGQEVSTSVQLTRLVSGRDAGERIRLRLRNDGEEREVELVLTPPLPIP